MHGWLESETINDVASKEHANQRISKRKKVTWRIKPQLHSSMRLKNATKVVKLKAGFVEQEQIVY